MPFDLIQTQIRNRKSPYRNSMQCQNDLVAHPFLVELLTVSQDIHTLINTQQSDSCASSGRQLDLIRNTRIFLWLLIRGFIMEFYLQRMAYKIIN